MKIKGSYFSYASVLFFYYFSMGIFGSILAVYLRDIGKTSGEISFIVSGSYIFAFALMPLVSYLYDRVRKPRQLTTGLLLLAAMVGIAFALSRHTILMFILQGLCISLVQCASPIFEQLCSSGTYRYGTVRVWGAVGYAVSAQTAGIVYQYVAPGLLFVLFALALSLTLFGFWTTTYEAKRGEPRQKPGTGTHAMFWKSAGFLLFLAASFIFAGTTGLNSTYLPMLLVERGLSISHTGSILFLGTMMEIPLIILSGKFMDKFREKTLLTVSFFILITQFSLYGLSHGYVVPLISCILLKSVATMLYIMITLKVVVNVVDERYTVSALGLTATIKSLGSVLFQNVGGNFIEHVGINPLYMGLAAFSLLGLILTLFIPMQTKNSRTVFQ